MTLSSPYTLFSFNFFVMSNRREPCPVKMFTFHKMRTSVKRHFKIIFYYNLFFIYCDQMKMR